MRKLIDADTTKKALKECVLWNADYEAEISCDIIDDQPAVDAVEVVRCKDCKNYWGDHYLKNNHTGMCVEKDDSYVDDDDYCSDGERE